MKEFNSKISAMAASSASGELDLPKRVNKDPLSIHGDGEDLLPQHTTDYLVLEILEGSKNSVGLIARAMSQPACWNPDKIIGADAPNGIEQPVQDARAKAPGTASGKKKRSPKNAASSGEMCGKNEYSPKALQKPHAGNNEADSRRSPAEVPIVVLEEEEGEEDPRTSKKIWNATSRRRGAFQRGLVRCVMLAHDAYIHRVGGDWDTEDPLREGQWHKHFPLDTLSMTTVLKMAEEAAEHLAIAEQSGRVK